MKACDEHVRRMGWFCSFFCETGSFIIVDSVPVDDDTSFERSEGDNSEGDCQNLLRSVNLERSFW